MTRVLALLALLACAGLPAAATPSPRFAHSAPLELEGKGALYALPLPLEVYRGIARRDLGDLRVLNGAGEVVPHALERPAGTEKKSGAVLSLAFFPLLAAPGRPVEDLSLRVERRPDGTLKAVLATGGRRDTVRRVAGYLIDASASKEPLRELRFAWAAPAAGTALDARLEASDDLRTWRPAASGPLLVLRRGEAVLERRALEFAPLRAKYLRLSWRAGQEDPKLSAVQAQAVDAAADAPRSWHRFEATAGAKPGEYLFELPPGLPVDRLRFELPQENTVVSASLIEQERPGGAERTMLSAVLYRMQHDAQKLVNPDLQVAPAAASRWLLRVDVRGGGLGSGLPALHAGWMPHRLLFVARGEAPFRLAFGSVTAPPIAMPAHSLVPGSGDRPVSALGARAGTVQTSNAPEKTPLAWANDYVESLDDKKLWLWGALLAAVLVIVGMAWRLAREIT